ncbi:hypothetical protein SVIOM342S_02716 [Streptomyces violaceorubidus]
MRPPGAQSLGGQRQVGDGAEAAEALAEDGPGCAAGDLGADGLAVADDGVGAEVGEVVGLLGGAAAQRERLAVGRGGGTGAALVQEQDPVLLQGAAEPGGTADETVRPEAGSALEVDQPGQVLVGLVARDGLAGVQLDRLPGGVGVVEGHGETAVGEDDAWLAVADAQGVSRGGRIWRPILSAVSQFSTPSCGRRPPGSWNRADRPVSGRRGWSAVPPAPAGGRPAGAGGSGPCPPARSPPGAARRPWRPW